MPTKAERKFESDARKNGWRAIRQAWPDYLCLGPDGDEIAVEVKTRHKSGRLARLTKDEAELMAWLEAKGVRCFVSDGEKAERFDPECHT